jgi:hypothetical protein
LCLASDNAEFDATQLKNPTVPAFKYKLVLDLLMIQDGYYKIFVPDSLIGALLSYTHLLGHKGITRMLVQTAYSCPYPFCMSVSKNMSMSMSMSCQLSMSMSMLLVIAACPYPCLSISM